MQRLCVKHGSHPRIIQQVLEFPTAVALVQAGLGASVGGRGVEHGKAAHRKSLPIDEKESMHWLDGYNEACVLAAGLPGRRIIMLADRECDIYEIYVRWQAEPKANFIVRVACGDCCAMYMFVRAKPRVYLWTNALVPPAPTSENAPCQCCIS